MRKLKQAGLQIFLVTSFFFFGCQNIFAQAPTLSDQFTGIWESIPSKTVVIEGAKLPGTLKVVRLRLCLSDGLLKGIISHPHIRGLEKLEIISQNVLSSNKVQLQLADKLEREITLLLVLENNQLKGSFSDEDINFVAELQNSFDLTTACKLESIDVNSPSVEGVSLDNNFNGTWKTKPQRTVNVENLNLPGSKRAITLKLCIENGILNGVIASNGVLQGSTIISQSIVSSSQANVEIQDKLGTTDSLKLILEGQVLKGVFDDGISFLAVRQGKENTKKTCMINIPDAPASPNFD